MNVNMAGHLGRCVVKLNCQVFEGGGGKILDKSSFCIACKHLAVFHEHINPLFVASSTRTASFAQAVEKLISEESY